MNLQNYPARSTEATLERRRTAAFLRAVVSSRRAFEKRLGPLRFADGARDILLDLYLCELEDRPVSVCDARIAASVPATTAARHVRALQQDGLVLRSNDEGDRRRSFLHLSDKAREEITCWLAATRAALLHTLKPVQPSG